MIEYRVVDGGVELYDCVCCKRQFPYFLFAGESDASDDLLGTATSCDCNEVVISEMTLDEWRSFRQGDGRPRFEQRLAQTLNRGDLRVPRILRIEQPSLPSPWLDPREYRKQYKPAQVILACPCCEHGESYRIVEITPAEFQRRGGRITVVGSLKVLANEGKPGSFVN